jgi:hypothetical protein
MRKGYTLSLAVVGVAACVAVFALNSAPSATQLYGTSPAEIQFQKYLAQYGKSYATKEEYNFRLQ